MDNILIIGGQLFNKGAQAMTFTVIDEIRSRGIDKNIVLLSDLDFKRPEIEKERYAFCILPYNNIMKFHLLGGVRRLLAYVYLLKRKSGKIACEAEVKSKFQNADMILDISGYGISSQWPWRRSMQYLVNIRVARKYKIPFYILPQSFGPFNYKKVLLRMILEHEMRGNLSYPKLIFAREEDGFKALSRFTKVNLKRSLDIVLQKKEDIDISRIFANPETVIRQNVIIKNSSVALIPNEKIMKHGDPQYIYKLYDNIIEHLLVNNKSIYILSHSSEDKSICEKIKGSFQYNNNVILLDNELYCFELQDVLSKFEFIIASRYHSIIHAYKTGIPAIALGWAVKYKALLEEFNQSAFCFDVRKNLNSSDIIIAINQMIAGHEKESETINKMRAENCENNIFDLIFKEN